MLHDCVAESIQIYVHMFSHESSRDSVFSLFIACQVNARTPRSLPVATPVQSVHARHHMVITSMSTGILTIMATSGRRAASPFKTVFPSAVCALPLWLFAALKLPDSHTP